MSKEEGLQAVELVRGYEPTYDRGEFFSARLRR